MTIWRMWIVGQLDASLVVLLLLAIAQLGRHRLSPTVRSIVLLIALMRLALPPFIQSPWSEAIVDLPPLDDSRTALFGWLQDDRALYLYFATSLVSVFLLTRLAGRMHRGHRSVLMSTRLAPEWVQMRVRALAAGSIPEVRISDRREGPFAAGIRSRLIVLPADLIDGLDHAALDAALAHEIAHHERHDLSWLAAAKALQAIAWFNPLAHLIARAIGSAREDGSDDWALRRTATDPFAYAHALLKSARLVTNEPGGVLAAGAHPMSGRLRRLLDGHTARDRRLGPIGVVVILLTLGLALPGAHSPNLQDNDDERIVVVIRR